ncbi:class I SAM-dependent DNA methyltransferase [Nocardioides bruguierae]|uniref:Class I SAM-dependent methyltransferase n=1 Tax=Nocardioides bruguierae TaxID=2945102 RepID=A0A9X2ID90_9ACTN|nr:class I SAM-dependent methyltransferase [Nocardioides bruguierae]MCL8025913.1 class I SAM-dependent methyltransferase [Nocardioides bruguierae]MCM0619027.1 class I SAM-dependent methyltransferase [Nocardioides bruguierae]
MSSSEVWDEATAARYDGDAAEMFAPHVLGPTLDRLEELADGGPVLELAIGTGRIGLALAQRGLEVAGIELSEPMVARLRAKPGGAALPVTVGDMASTRVAGEFSLVVLVWNTLSNLRTQEEQVACFANAARHLRPGGRFVVEQWVPPIQRLLPGERVVPMSLDESHLVFDAYDVVSQQCTSHHYHHDTDGTVRHATGTFRYAWPSECDLMARLAGLSLEHRWADWSRTPFTAESTDHVSVWRTAL